MELETAAPQALSRVEELEKELDDARKELEGSQERLREARERLDADGGALAEAAEAFQATVAEQRTHLVQASEKSGQALSELTEALRSSHEEAARELGQAAGALSGLEERARALDPAVEEGFSDAVAAAESVKGFVEDTSSQLEQALGTARGLLDVATQDLEGMQELVQRRVEEIGEFGEQAWTPVLEDIADAWGEALAGAVGAAVAAGVEMANENLPQVLAEATEQCRSSTRRRSRTWSSWPGGWRASSATWPQRSSRAPA